jgi:dolichol-phosphate mannosyltransferase
MSNFGIYSKKAIDTIKEMRENVRYFPVMILWAGFRSSAVDIAHAKRGSGLSSYTLKKLMHLAFNVIISFSEKPLRLVIKLGFTIASLSFFCALYLFLRAVFVKQTVLGWSSLIVSIWFLSGLIIFFLGIVGTYIGKAFEQTKKRPLYIIDKTTHP